MCGETAKREIRSARDRYELIVDVRRSAELAVVADATQGT
jgi:hypothetical protein